MAEIAGPFKKVSVLGAGSFGTAIADHIAGNTIRYRLPVILYGRDSETIESVNRYHVNPKRLPALTLDPRLTVVDPIVRTA
jgi:glycerol-3-phosphate dehydrogenase (NAD(P)+)